MSVTPSAQYRLTIRVKIDEQQGMLGQVTDMIGEQGGMVVAVDLVEAGAGHSVRDIVVDAAAATIGTASSRRSARSPAPR